MRCLVVTTPSIEGRRVTRYLGIVSGEAILGANLFRDLFAGIRDIVGGRSAAYEKELAKARQVALDEMSDKARHRGEAGLASAGRLYGMGEHPIICARSVVTRSLQRYATSSGLGDDDCALRLVACRVEPAYGRRKRRQSQCHLAGPRRS